MSFAGKWMGLEIIMVPEISQTQKDKYHVFSYMWNLYFFYKRHENRKATIWEREGDQWERGRWDKIFVKYQITFNECMKMS
jgi:hypothetical protein